MTFSVNGSLPTDLAARIRIGISEAGHMVGQALVKRARDGILSGSKSGAYYDTLFFTIGSGAGRRIVAYGSRPGHQASAAGEYSANDTAGLLNSIAYRMQGSFISFYATSPHAGYQEYGTDKIAARQNLKKAIDESDAEIRAILQQIVFRALGR